MYKTLRREEGVAPEQGKKKYRKRGGWGFAILELLIIIIR